MAAAPIGGRSRDHLGEHRRGIQAALRGVADGDLTETAVVQADGSIRVTSDGANAITNLQISVPGNTWRITRFNFPCPLRAGGPRAIRKILLRPAVAAGYVGFHEIFLRRVVWGWWRATT
jgi:hypothetical protein